MKKEQRASKKRKVTAHVKQMHSLKLKKRKYVAKFRVAAGARDACYALRKQVGQERFYTPGSGTICPMPGCMTHAVPAHGERVRALRVHHRITRLSATPQLPWVPRSLLQGVD